MEHELLILAEHMSSHSDFQWGSCFSIFSSMCCVLQICLSVPFLLVIVLSPLQLMASHFVYPFGIVKLFLHTCRISVNSVTGMHKTNKLQRFSNNKSIYHITNNGFISCLKPCRVSFTKTYILVLRSSLKMNCKYIRACFCNIITYLY